MKIAGNKFTGEIIEMIKKERILGIRAGSGSSHRVIGIWAVVVEGRIFVRSWSMKPRGWWRAFLEDPHGSLIVGEKEFKVRTVQTRSERLKDLVSAAYKDKYNKPGDIQFVKDMCGRKSRNTTTELLPVSRTVYKSQTR